MSLLEANNLVKSYGSRIVVKNVDVRVQSGEIIGLLGRNGAGKTTIFQMIEGLVRPDSGHIFLDGEDIPGLPPTRGLWPGSPIFPRKIQSS